MIFRVSLGHLLSDVYDCFSSEPLNWPSNTRHTSTQCWHSENSTSRMSAARRAFKSSHNTLARLVHNVQLCMSLHNITGCMSANVTVVHRVI